MRRVLTIVLLAIPSVLFAADTPFDSTMNLANHINDSISVPVGAKITVHVINKAPANTYDETFEPYTMAPEAITPPAFKSGTPPAAGGAQSRVMTPAPLAAADAARAATRTLMAKLAAEVDERQVPAEVFALSRAMDKLDTDEDSELSNAAQTLIDSTKEDLVADSALTADEGTILTIHRGPAGALPEQTWTRNFHVGGPGRFISNYVFAFAPKLDEEYFAKPTDADPAKFTIAKSVRRDKVSYVPLVLFSWIPASKGNDAFIGGPSAGLGYDLSNLVVAGSYLWTWHRNLGVTFGVMAQKQDRLKGIYNLKDPVAANTTLTEAVWRPDVFIGISIRSVSALFH